MILEFVQSKNNFFDESHLRGERMSAASLFLLIIKDKTKKIRKITITYKNKKKVLMMKYLLFITNHTQKI